MKINWLATLGLLIIFWALEIFSFAATYNLPAFILLIVLTAALTIYRSEYGLLALLAELFIGSMGHLFYLELGEARLPLRVGMFAAFMSVFSGQFAWQLIKERSQSAYWRALSSFSGWRWYGLLGVAILVAILNAYWQQNEPAFIFSDLNGWLYLFIIVPLVAIYSQASGNTMSRLRTLFIAGVFWVSLKTLFVLFMFAHEAIVAPALYYWLRRIIGGEVTVGVAGWPRVFIQGQVFAVIAYLATFWLRPNVKKVRDIFSLEYLSYLFAGTLFFSVTLISLSRSFWVGLIAALGASFLFLLIKRAGREIYLGILWLGLSALLAIVLIYGLMAIPYRSAPSLSLGDSLLDRVSSSDPATASRWSLLPVLWEEIGQEPILGQGYGATVTYLSSDPRVLALNPQGEYTTYAFEWGYLDIWLKLGLLGLIVYLGLIGKLIWRASQKGDLSSQRLYIALGAGLVFVAATNIFTPFLNHPLGLGYLALSSCLIFTNKVY